MGLRGLTVPAPRLGPRDSVLEASRVMHRAKLGAVSVTEDGKLSGIFTYRDLIERIVLARRDPGDTALADVMTKDVESISVHRSPGVALRMMVRKDFTYLPVVDERGGFVGMLSLRGLLEHEIEKLADELDSLEKYVDVEGGSGG